MFELSSEAEERGGRALVGTLARNATSIAVGLLFVVIGYTKFNGDPSGEWYEVFERIGLGQWFRVFTGVVQVAGGVLMLPRRTRTAGAALLGSTMLGAAAVDVLVMGSPVVIIPLLLLILIAVVWVTSR
jgi:putative oxidoreductase